MLTFGMYRELYGVFLWRVKASMSQGVEDEIRKIKDLRRAEATR